MDSALRELPMHTSALSRASDGPADTAERPAATIYNAAQSTFSIAPQGPFSWAAACEVLRHFPPLQHHGRGNADVLRLAFPLDHDYTPVAVALHGDGGILHGEVRGSDRLEAVARQVARIFSLDHDGRAYPALAERAPELGPLMAALPGLRPVCFTSPYECAAWAIISLRISMRQAAVIQGRLIAEHGHALRVAGAEVQCFPVPERLLAVTEAPGLSSEKVERLHGVAHAALNGLLDADTLRALRDEAAPAALRAIRGIGPFWASGIYLRACGIRDVFPVEPLALAALGTLHGLGHAPNAAAVLALTERYRPYRMWVCFLLRVAAGRGLIAGITEQAGAIRRARRTL